MRECEMKCFGMRTHTYTHNNIYEVIKKQRMEYYRYNATLTPADRGSSCWWEHLWGETPRQCCWGDPAPWSPLLHPWQTPSAAGWTGQGHSPSGTPHMSQVTRLSWRQVILALVTCACLSLHAMSLPSHLLVGDTFMMNNDSDWCGC